jgi:pimeloyl-ACP methyl ester carboxylesterase
VSLGDPTRGWPFTRALRQNIRHLREAKRNGGCAVPCERERTDGSRLPWNTGGLYGGWGGFDHHGTHPGAERTPVVFVHGNQRDACDWESHAEFFLQRGYLGDELWAVSFADGSPSHDEMARTLEDFVHQVCEETGADEVSLVAHSLGVTGVRWWMLEYDRYEVVETFVGLAGANHGTVLTKWAHTAGMRDGTYKMSPFLRADYDRVDDHPLARLNAEETPGDVDYYTIRGTEDPLFWRCRESPALEGATDAVLEADHDGVRTSRRAHERTYEWVSGEHPYDLRNQVGLPQGAERAAGASTKRVGGDGSGQSS